MYPALSFLFETFKCLHKSEILDRKIRLAIVILKGLKNLGA
jgi:hypothetical protein